MFLFLKSQFSLSWAIICVGILKVTFISFQIINEEFNIPTIAANIASHMNVKDELDNFN